MLALVIVLAAALAALAIYVVWRERKFADHRAQFADHRARYTATSADVEAARSHSVATSKGSTLGQAAEHLAPVFPEMVERFLPGDWRFLGSPVDYVVLDGLTSGRVERVVLVEVKSGDPRLNDRQAQIQAAVAMGSLPVAWLTLNCQSRHGRAHAEGGLGSSNYHPTPRRLLSLPPIGTVPPR
jgi:predicted Holliday junction resolvase-like endonuclease